MFAVGHEVSKMERERHWIKDPAGPSIAFGPFRLFPTQRLLTEGDQPVHLGSRAFDILVALLERAGELVSKEELMARVWPNTFVVSANLPVHISALRRALGDGHQGNRYIVNVPGRGYRFVAPVTVEKQPRSDSAAALPTREQNLPAYFAQPAGRAEIVDGLLKQLPQRRLLAVVGRDGISQTTALAVLQKLIGAHENDVWLVDLTPPAKA
jgi:DNA-binding winged helix-turn-helix (wHTH) protein